MMSIIFTPAMRFLRGLRISHKFLLVALAFSIPLIGMVALLVQKMNQEMQLASAKQAALSEISQLTQVSNQLQAYRSLRHMQQVGNKQLGSELSKLGDTLQSQFQNQTGLADLQSDWQALQTVSAEIKPAKLFTMHSELLQKLRLRSQQLATQSQLALDSDSLVHQLIQVRLNQLPLLENYIAILAGRGAAYIDSGLMEAGEELELSSTHMLSNLEIRKLREQIQQLKQSHSELTQAQTQADSTLASLEMFLNRAKDEVLASVNQTSGKEFYGAASTGLHQLSELEQALDQVLAQRLQLAAQQLQSQSLLHASAIVLLLLAAAYLFIAIYLALSRELQTLAVAVTKTSAGDLQSEVQSKGKDELAELTNAIGKMNLNLSQIVDNIRQGAQHISDISYELHGENNDLFQRTEAQAQALQQTAATLEQLTSTVIENTTHLERANQLVCTSAEQTEQGQQVMQASLQAMQNVIRYSEKIEEIVGLMDGIAFQTNILALNAAVEAARAGNHGKGFAVVANEVRRLAQGSAEAAKEIKELISSSSSAVTTSSKQLQRADQTMQAIANNVSTLHELIAQITRAGQEQSTAIAHVNQAITEIDQWTQQNSVLVEQASHSAEQLEQESHTLIDAVSKFKTRLSQPGGTVNTIHLVHSEEPNHKVLSLKSGRKALRARVANLK